MKKIWYISSKEYQEHIWVRHEDSEICDSYDDTTEGFYECEGILEDPSDIIISDSQYQMLKKLYDMVYAYDTSEARPESDKDIVSDPKWHEIQKYAKKVYDELQK
ncbi:hypothetical protein [Candidatus Neptunochlamydia vexilliferae]|nr:hypothetical protein [Candidatus Neptunochlamydia vexilliferae]